jgi:ABC-type transport system substrate-binding protein
MSGGVRVLHVVLKLAARVAVALLLSGSVGALGADPNKILRLAIFDIETLDPQQYTDDPSSQVVAAIFEGLYDWDYLASPTRLVPVTATALPEITDGGKTWTMRLQHGIRFTDDPAFKGKPRELVADDIVYSMKRSLDPNLKRGGSPTATEVIMGARGVVDAASKAGAKFDYDRPIEGLRALDRYTVQIRLSRPNFPIVESLVTVGAVAREVVDAGGGNIRTRASGPARTCCANGGRVRASCSMLIRTIARSSSPRAQTRTMRRSCAACAESRCRKSASSSSMSSRKKSRASCSSIAAISTTS